MQGKEPQTLIAVMKFKRKCRIIIDFSKKKIFKIDFYPYENLVAYERVLRKLSRDAIAPEHLHWIIVLG